MSNLINGNFEPGQGTTYGDCATFKGSGTSNITIFINFKTTINFATIYLGGANDTGNSDWVN